MTLIFNDALQGLLSCPLFHPRNGWCYYQTMHGLIINGHDWMIGERTTTMMSNCQWTMACSVKVHQRRRWTIITVDGLRYIFSFHSFFYPLLNYKYVANPFNFN